MLSWGQPPAISYETPNLYTSGQTITPLVPVQSGGVVAGNSRVTFVASDLTSNPQDIAVDGMGNVYIANSFGSVNKIAADGSRSVLGTQIPHTYNLAIDGPGKYLYVVDYFSDFWLITTSNGIVTKLGSGGYGAVTVDDAGNAYVTHNGFVEKYAVNGSVSTLTAFAFRSYPDIAVDKSGSKLYLSEYAANEFTVKVFTIATGETSSLPIHLPYGQTHTGLLADNQDHIFISDDINGRFFEFDQANGNLTTTLVPSPGDVYGYLLTTSVDNNWNVYALTNFVKNNGTGQIGRVLKFSTVNYTIDKLLPAGLIFSEKTGAISGTPVARSPATDYTVTAYNTYGSGSTIVNIKIDQALTPSVITFLPPSTVQIDADNILRPVISSNNMETPITYTSSDPTVAYIGADGLIHVIAPGPVTITASQNGNENYSPATPVSQLFRIMQAQLIYFQPLIGKRTCDGDFDAGAITSNPLLPVKYFSSNSSVATISEQGVIHIVAAGTTQITASQNGNELYYPAMPQTRDLTVTPPVIPLVTISADLSSVCTGDQVTFTAAVSNINTALAYQWKVNGVNTGPNSNTFSTTTLTRTDNVQCVVTNNSSCGAVGISNTYSSINVAEYMTPAITITSSSTTPACAGTSITFTAVPTGAANPVYQWFVNHNDAGINSAVFKAENLRDQDIVFCRLVITNGHCLTANIADSNPITVQILNAPEPAPSVTIINSGPGKYEGAEMTFNAVAANANSVISYKWTVNGVPAGSNNSIFTGRLFRNNDVIACTIISSIPCSVPATSQPITLSLLPPLSINVPNTFTPNGDGVNDLWDIPDLISFPNSSVSIYNRYGKQVFYTRSAGVNWNGTINGKELPVATYYYVIDLGRNNQRLSGSVTIIK